MLSRQDKKFLIAHGKNPSIFKYIRVFSDDGQYSKIIERPKGWLVLSPVQVFCNFHLFGVKYAYTTLGRIIEYMNTDLMTNCWILSDESSDTDARDSMTGAGKLVAKFGATIGKRRAHMILLSQYPEMIERRYRLFRTTKVMCNYNSATKCITCDIKMRDKPPFSVTYYAPPYWKFYDTNEIIKVAQKKIDKALEGIT